MSGRYIEVRPSNQFPSKFSALPHIGGPETGGSPPVGVPDTRLVPYTGGRHSPGDDSEARARLRQLESRVNVAEKSNRALLEEVVRLQSELKVTLRRTDDSVRDERVARQQIENALRGSSDVIAQLSTRLARAEEKGQEEKAAMAAIASQTKAVQQALIATQQEVVGVREQQGTRLEDVRNTAEEANRARDQLERLTYQLADELRQVKSKVDTQVMDFASVASELKNKSKRLEDETRQSMESLRKHGESQNHTEQSTHQLRTQVETRLAELRDVLLDLRNKQEQETQQRHLAEQQQRMRLTEVQSALAEQQRRREEAMHALERVGREAGQAVDSERIRLQGRLAEVSEDVSNKMLQKEIKLREESQARFAQLEQMLMEEQEARQKFEREYREAGERRLESQQKLTRDEITTLREQLKHEKRKTTENLHQLNKALNLLEKQMEEGKRQQDKLLGAEIQSRRQEEKTAAEQISALQDKLNVAMVTLQQAMGGVSSQLSSQSEKFQEELREMIAEHKSASTRQVADLDDRLVALSQKVAQGEADMAKVDEITAHAKDQQQRLDALSEWRAETDRDLQQSKEDGTQLKENVSTLQEKQEALKSDTDSKLDEETKKRTEDVEELRAALRAKSGGKRASSATNGDIQACQTSIRKLAESIQTVKTVLGMKIQSEQKLRVEEIRGLRDELVALRALVDPLLHPDAEARLFVKPMDKGVSRLEAESSAPDINKWSVFNAYRWLRWKSRWTYTIWRRQAAERERGGSPSTQAVPSSPGSGAPSPEGENPSPQADDPSPEAEDPSRTEPPEIPSAT